MEHASDAGDARRVPVALNGDRLLRSVDCAVARPTDLERPAKDLGSRVSNGVRVFSVLRYVRQLRQGSVAQMRVCPLRDVEPLAENTTDVSCEIVKWRIHEGERTGLNRLP